MPVKTRAKDLGDKAENAALTYIQQRGGKLVERNFNCRLGEIDLIIQDESTLAFVEVRFRSNASHGNAAESVTARKQQRIIRAAQFYLSRTQQQAVCRLDVLTIDSANGQLQIEWIKNAFQTN